MRVPLKVTALGPGDPVDGGGGEGPALPHRGRCTILPATRLPQGLGRPQCRSLSCEGLLLMFRNLHECASTHAHASRIPEKVPLQYHKSVARCSLCNAGGVWDTPVGDAGPDRGESMLCEAIPGTTNCAGEASGEWLEAGGAPMPGSELPSSIVLPCARPALAGIPPPSCSQDQDWFFWCRCCWRRFTWRCALPADRLPKEGSASTSTLPTLARLANAGGAQGTCDSSPAPPMQW